MTMASPLYISLQPTIFLVEHNLIPTFTIGNTTQGGQVRQATINLIVGSC